MKNSLELINEILKIDQNIHGKEYLKIFVKNIAIVLGVRYVLIGHSVNNKQIETDVVWANNDYANNFVYDLKDTPCEIVFDGNRVCIHESNVSKEFSDDRLLQEMNVESYVGAPVSSSKDDESFGLLVILDDKPMKDSAFYKAACEFLALRAGVEIERFLLEQTMTEKVNEQNLELKLVNAELKEANNEIESLNTYLEKKVEEEVLKNENKNKIISERSKMALMGEMLENIAHQWKHPLSTITTASSGCKLQKELGILNDNDFVSSMDAIMLAANYLANTIDDFRNFFSKSKLNTEFQMKNVITKTSNLMLPKFKSNNIELIISVDNLTIFGYENELVQVIMNLLNNSCDELTSSNEEFRLIFIDIYLDNQGVIIKIKDNAGGIKVNNIDSIFDLYMTTKENDTGTGIGLYMSREIIEKHMQGKISATNVGFTYENRKYDGAEFTISIPISND